MSCDNSLSVCESKSLAKKLKMEDPEQFQTLVRMHLSFVLDLTTEDADSLGEKSKARSMKWSFVPFTKKLKGPVKDHPEGVPLSRQVIDQVHQLIVFLTKEENVVQEGIFRRSGKMTRQQELKSMLSKGNEVCLDEGAYSVHDAASVLKTFLAELPEPLITEAYYPAYCQIAELCQNEECSKERVLCSLQLLFLLLPDDNRVVLKDILCLLNLTASHSDSNLMSAQNLATLFTPHLVCPRKLSPEIFHAAAQNLSCVVVFMITEGTAVFEIPGALATDIKAYFDRKKLNDRQLETSISEGSAAKTVYSFVDREKTAQENISNPTEMALAALYAHIQSLPESNKKKRLIKQFNKGNGPGTPKPKSLGDSIKKHLFSKNLKGKGLADFQQSKNEFSSSDDQLNSPFEKKSHRTPLSHKIRMNLGGCSEGRSGSKRRSPSLSDNDENVRPNDNDDGENNAAQTVSLKSLTEPCSDDSPPSSSGNSERRSQDVLLTSTPAVGCLSTPVNQPPDDMSPISMSAQRMPKAMQEAMITPRSRKPVVVISGSNLSNTTTLSFAPNSARRTEMDTWGRPVGTDFQTPPTAKIQVGEEEEADEDSLTSPFRDYLFSRSVLTASPTDLSFSSRPGDFDPCSSSIDGDDVVSDVAINNSASFEGGDSRSPSDSLLYFLNGGGTPPFATGSSGCRLLKRRDRPRDDESQLNVKRRSEDFGETVTETSL